ncbi:hypothetical protein IM660_06335 [Ruania alkalisoli]|uniref:DUF3137 domain-containing protein n=1 Tax=Ruania alkalisoli TaxID=2779775 RepID=A0A7M1SWF1_9MICO|nr:hypothetical protein [Ruania alkalisoli]QOR71875.1 hypothetical protein IM660_06335 [Ruania alkalisoli]
MDTPWIIVVTVGAILLGVGIAALAVVAALRGSGADRRSAADVAAAAQPAGWTYVGTDAAVLDRLRLRHLFPDARSARTSHVMHRQVAGRSAVACGTKGRGWSNEANRRRTRVTVSGSNHSMCTLELPGPLPTFNLLSEGRGGAAATSLGLLSDLDTESHEFNERLRVVTADDRLAHALLAPTVIAAMQDGPPQTTLQIVGNQLVSFRQGVPDPAELAARAAWLGRVAAAIPAFVYQGR